MDRNKPWLTLIVTSLVIAVAGWKALGLERDDDLLAFLPETHPKIVEFREMASTFGNTQLVLIGLQHPERVTDKSFRDRLDDLSKSLKMVPGVHDVVGLTTITDFTVNDLTGALELRLLLDERQFSSDEAMLKDILSRKHLVGTILSEDGKHTLLYAYVAPDADPLETVGQIESALNERFSQDEYHLGGAPVISADIFEQTKRDLDALTPWAVVVIVVLLMLAYRDVVGAGIALVVTGGAITIAIGGLVAFGEPLNVVVSAAPIVLFAVGTAFSQHLLSHYLEYRREMEPTLALQTALEKTRGPLTAAAFTSALGLASFVVMDLKPVRVFGLFTASGIVLSWVGARFVLPSFLTLFPLKAPKSLNTGFVGAAEVILRVPGGRTIWGLGFLCLVSAGWGLTKLDSRVDMDALLPSESRGAQAMDYIAQHFGGSEFVFVNLEGDLRDPVVLHGIEALTAELQRIDGVHDIMHVGVLLNRTYEGMVGRSGLPTNSAQASTLFGLLTGAPMISQLVSPEQNETLLQIRLKPLDLDETESSLEEIRACVRRYSDFGNLSLEARRETWANALLGTSDTSHYANYTMAKNEMNAITRSELVPELENRIAKGEWLVEVDALIELSASDVAQSWVRGGDDPEAWVAWLKSQGISIEVGPLSEDAWFALGDIAMSVEESLKRTSLVASLVKRVGASGEPEKLERLWEVYENEEALSGSPRMVWKVNGLPVMYEGLSESIEDNQMRSTGAAFIAVILFLSLLLRHISTVFWIALPITFTLLCIYGGMGLLGIHLDIGTSMLASLALGVGVDYAVHAFMGADGLSRGSAAAIITNALVVAAGFSVLTLASSPPIRVMGGLTAVSMVLAALTTLMVYTLTGRRNWLMKGKH